MDSIALDDSLKGLLLKDLRIQCRARGVSPAGSREALMQRIKEHMIETQDYTMKAEGSRPPSQTGEADAFSMGDVPHGNNYGRPEGQNVGNFLTDRPSSRVLAAPGGASQILFGDEAPPAAKKAAAPQPTVTIDATGSNSLYMGAKQEEGNNANKRNNYGRPEGQNVGNFLTDRNSSRVLAPPGGASQISFG